MCAVAMNEDGRLFYTVIRKVAIRINDAAVTNDVFVIFQPCLFPPLPFRPASLPQLSSFFTLPSPPARALLFTALPGSRFTRRGSETGDGEARREKRQRERRAAQQNTREGKINCRRGCVYCAHKEQADRSMTLPVGDSAFKQQIRHRRFMNARRQVPFDTHTSKGTECQIFIPLAGI